MLRSSTFFTISPFLWRTKNNFKTHTCTVQEFLFLDIWHCSSIAESFLSSSFHLVHVFSLLLVFTTFSSCLSPNKVENIGNGAMWCESEKESGVSWKSSQDIIRRSPLPPVSTVTPALSERRVEDKWGSHHNWSVGMTRLSLTCRMMSFYTCLLALKPRKPIFSTTVFYIFHVKLSHFLTLASSDEHGQLYVSRVKYGRSGTGFFPSK